MEYILLSWEMEGDLPSEKEMEAALGFKKSSIGRWRREVYEWIAQRKDAIEIKDLLVPISWREEGLYLAPDPKSRSTDRA